MRIRVTYEDGSSQIEFASKFSLTSGGKLELYGDEGMTCRDKVKNVTRAKVTPEGHSEDCSCILCDMWETGG